MNTLFSPELLMILERQLDRYIAMAGFIKTSELTSGVIMSSPGIQMVERACSMDTHLVTECYSFLDALALLELVYACGEVRFAEEIIARCVGERQVRNKELLMNPEIVREFVTDDVSALHGVFRENIPLTALFIYSVLHSLFYK